MLTAFRIRFQLDKLTVELVIPFSAYVMYCMYIIVNACCFLSFITEIFNNTSYEILHRAYEKWCDELMSVSSDSNCDP